MARHKVKPGERVYAILHADGKQVHLLGFGHYVGDEVPTEPTGFFRAIFGASTWAEVDKACGYAVPRPSNPKIVLDDGTIIWGAECWWGPESDYAAMLGTRTEVKATIEDARASEERAS
jgi:hypothetical protein